MSLRTPLLLAAYLAAALITLYPLASVEIPGLGDYLNHLARIHILTSIDSSPYLRRYYEVHWAPVPYLTMDIVISFFAKFLPLYAAGRAFVALCVLLPVAGTAALHYAVYRRASLVPLAAFLVSYNYLLSWGFLAYLLSVSFCLFALAAYIATRDRPRWPRAASFAVVTLAIYFTHPFGVLALGLAIFGYEFARAWRRGFRPLAEIASDAAAVLAQFIPVAALAFVTDIGRVAAGAPLTSFGSLDEKVTAIASPLTFLGGRVETLVAILVAIALLGSLLSPRVRRAPELISSAMALAFASLFVPEWLSGVWGADLRLPTVIVLIVIAALSLRFSRRQQWLFVATVLALVALKSWLATAALVTVDGQIAEARRVIAALPLGARLLPAEVDAQTGPLRPGPWHMTSQEAMTAVIDRDAFVPFLFSGLLIVNPRAAMQDSSSPHGEPVRVRDLFAGLSPGAIGLKKDDGQGRRLYWLGWPRKFDYVLLQHYGAPPGALPSNLKPVATSRTVNLYRVER